MRDFSLAKTVVSIGPGFAHEYDLTAMRATHIFLASSLGSAKPE
jgi:hypothetical protein